MKPIFIGGCVRSGTTMLGSMLGAHPRHVCPPEMQFKLGVFALARGDRRISTGEARAAASAHWKTAVLGWELDRHAWEFDAETPADALRGIAREYGRLHDRPDALAWIDHSPNNIRIASTLADAFPDSFFVHIVRDGRAVAASMMRVDWGPGDAFDAAHFWLERLAQGLAAESCLGERCVRVRYEDLVTEPEPTVRHVCDAAGIEFHPEMTQGSGFQPTAYIKDQHALVGGRPDKGRVNAWERQLQPREVEIFEAVVGDALTMLGYEPRFGIHARPATRKERRSASIRQAVASRVGNRVRKRARIRAGRRAAGGGNG